MSFAATDETKTPGRFKKASVLDNLDPSMLASLTKALSTAKKEPVRYHHPSVVNSRPRAPLSPNTRINTIDHATTNDDGGGISTPVRNLSSALNSVEDSVSKVYLVASLFRFV